MYQQARAFDVPQELVAQAGAIGRPLDQPGDIGHDKLVIIEPHHAQVGLERGKGDSRRSWGGQR